MPTVRTASLRTENGDLVVEIEVDDASVESRRPFIRVTLGEHDDVSGEFAIDFRCDFQGDRYAGRFTLEPKQVPRLLEIASVRYPDETVVVLTSRMLFLEPGSGTGRWDSGAPAQARLEELAKSQESRYSQAIVATGSSTSDPKFAVLLIADNLLITRWQRVPGIAVLPVTDPGFGTDEVTLLNQILAETGFLGSVDPNWWTSTTARIRPSIAILLPVVHAADLQAAADVSRSSVLSLLDLLAMRRGAAPRLLAGVIGAWNDDVVHVQFSWIEGGYGGNLLGGFISGEDQHGLLQQWDGVLQNPRARLWLSLYEDALRETRWDFRLFRLFSMLESIGAEILPPNATILDDNGQPRMMNGTDPFTTEKARGKVYEVAKKAKIELGVHFNGDQFWELISPWVSVRNQVAHRGGWALPEGQKPDKERARLERKVSERGHDGTFDSGIDAMLREIRGTAVEVLAAALSGKL